GFHVVSEAKETICAVEHTVLGASSGKTSFTAVDVLDVPICRLSGLDTNERDMALFQNQFGGIYIRRGGVRLISRRTLSGDRVSATYEITHDVCEVPYRLIVLEDASRSRRSAILHLRDAASSLAEIRWAASGPQQAECRTPLYGRRLLPTLEVLVAAAVVLRFGTRGEHLGPGAVGAAGASAAVAARRKNFHVDLGPCLPASKPR
ncbi:hypothetical protein HK405_001047, partial [Cladochytrium tenue]